MINRLFGPNSTEKILTRSLGARSARNRAIADNIANISTPGYRRKEVRFEGALRAAMDKRRLRGVKTDSAHRSIGTQRPGDVQHSVVTPNDPTRRSGVNNVDIDTEMAKLAENQIGYRYGVKFLNGKYKKLNAAIQGKSVV